MAQGRISPATAAAKGPELAVKAWALIDPLDCPARMEFGLDPSTRCFLTISGSPAQPLTVGMRAMVWWGLWEE